MLELGLETFGLFVFVELVYFVPVVLQLEALGGAILFVALGVTLGELVFVGGGVTLEALVEKGGPLLLKFTHLLFQFSFISQFFMEIWIQIDRFKMHFLFCLFLFFFHILFLHFLFYLFLLMFSRRIQKIIIHIDKLSISFPRMSSIMSLILVFHYIFIGVHALSILRSRRHLIVIIILPRIEWFPLTLSHNFIQPYHFIH